MYIDAHKIFIDYQGRNVEISFMEGTESYQKYGRTVGGELTFADNTSNQFIPVMIPRGKINITKAQVDGWESKSLNVQLGLIVNHGCERIYNISKENVKKIKSEGFSVTHIENNSIKEIG
ncbi:MAG: hypothetical protein VR77_05220 [Flavobacteriales bacterium BRH_c54]|nr:MAG: hypothetical protein VR77_05220 [Flavobacteriales bacterium BRH_c54]